MGGTSTQEDPVSRRKVVRRLVLKPCFHGSLQKIGKYMPIVPIKHWHRVKPGGKLLSTRHHHII